MQPEEHRWHSRLQKSPGFYKSMDPRGFCVWSSAASILYSKPIVNLTIEGFMHSWISTWTHLFPHSLIHSFIHLWVSGKWSYCGPIRAWNCGLICVILTGRSWISWTGLIPDSLLETLIEKEHFREMPI